MKIISYNVNGIRAAIKKGLLNWIKIFDPDFICIQECKATLDQINIDIIENIGYKILIYPALKKGYSGVAMIYKKKYCNFTYTFGIGIDEIDKEARVLTYSYNNTKIINIYVPSANNISRLDFKMNFCEKLFNYIHNMIKNNEKLIICGDFNICKEKIDIHNPISNAKKSGFLPVEREWINYFIKKLNIIDCFRYINSNKIKYSWWSYRRQSRVNNKGWRIDYIFLSNNLKNKIIDCDLLNEINHSDHCPVYVKLQI